MAEIKFRKEVSELPQPLEPDTVYYVRTGTGFDLYVQDHTGQMAHKLNQTKSDNKISVINENLLKIIPENVTTAFEVSYNKSINRFIIIRSKQFSAEDLGLDISKFNEHFSNLISNPRVNSDKTYTLSFLTSHEINDFYLVDCPPIFKSYGKNKNYSDDLYYFQYQFTGSSRFPDLYFDTDVQFSFYDLKLEYGAVGTPNIKKSDIKPVVTNDPNDSNQLQSPNMELMNKRFEYVLDFSFTPTSQDIRVKLDTGLILEESFNDNYAGAQFINNTDFRSDGYILYEDQKFPILQENSLDINLEDFNRWQEIRPGLKSYKFEFISVLPIVEHNNINYFPSSLYNPQIHYTRENQLLIKVHKNNLKNNYIREVTSNQYKTQVEIFYNTNDQNFLYVVKTFEKNNDTLKPEPISRPIVDVKENELIVKSPQLVKLSNNTYSLSNRVSKDEIFFDDSGKNYILNYPFTGNDEILKRMNNSSLLQLKLDKSDYYPEFIYTGNDAKNLVWIEFKIRGQGPYYWYMYNYRASDTQQNYHNQVVDFLKQNTYYDSTYNYGNYLHSIYSTDNEISFYSQTASPSFFVRGDEVPGVLVFNLAYPDWKITFLRLIPNQDDESWVVHQEDYTKDEFINTLNSYENEMEFYTNGINWNTTFPYKSIENIKID